MGQWLVLIARDRRDLWVSWAAFYGGAGTVEVLFDRRQGHSGAGTGDRRDPRAGWSRDRDLQECGFLVIPRPENVGAFR